VVVSNNHREGPAMAHFQTSDQSCAILRQVGLQIAPSVLVQSAYVRLQTFQQFPNERAGGGPR